MPVTGCDRAHAIDDFRELARRALPRMIFDFIDGGSGAEATLRENRAALERVRLVGSAPVDVGARSQEVVLFGRRFAMPVVIGPTGLAGAAWPKADLHLARAAGEHDIPFVMSSAATATMEEVAAQGGPGAKWFQLYLFRDRAVSQRLISRARDLGFEALEVTIDNAVPGRRLRDSRNGFSLPLTWTPRKVASIAAHPAWALRMARTGVPKLEVMGAELGLEKASTIAEVMQAQLDPTVTWDDIAWVRDQWRGPLMVKGLLDPGQVRRAVAIGADGMVVSNHGGRQLDGAVATIDMLPEFAAEAGSRITILIDSGFRSGTDIAKALALGAHAVQVGRTTLYAVAAGGERAVARALSILRAEFDIAQCLMGARTAADFSPAMVRSPTVSRAERRADAAATGPPSVPAAAAGREGRSSRGSRADAA